MLKPLTLKEEYRLKWEEWCTSKLFFTRDNQISYVVFFKCTHKV